MKRNYFAAVLSLFALAIVLGGTLTANAQTSTAQAQYRKALDFDGDGRADLTVIRPSNKIWYTRSTATGAIITGNWGNNSLEFVVAGDYDGDGKGDYAIIRRTGENSVWYILPSGGGGFRAVTFGISLPLDNPIQGDYDGDGKTDIAIVRNNGDGNTLTWYIIQSTNNQVIARTVTRDSQGEGCRGLAGVDIDGDGKTDIAQICTTIGGNNIIWSIIRSSDNVVERYVFGLNSIDSVVPGDYDGDGKTDVAVIRNFDTGNNTSRYDWYIRRSSNGSLQTHQFGGNFGNFSYDNPVQADYDGDGKTDIAVYRRSQINGEPQYFYILRSGSDYSFRGVNWGTTGDNPTSIFPDYLTF